MLSVQCSRQSRSIHVCWFLDAARDFPKFAKIKEQSEGDTTTWLMRTRATQQLSDLSERGQAPAPHHEHTPQRHPFLSSANILAQFLSYSSSHEPDLTTCLSEITSDLHRLLILNVMIFIILTDSSTCQVKSTSST